jgi:hypothetical protein
LIIGKDTSDDNHSSQYNAQEQLKHPSQQSQPHDQHVAEEKENGRGCLQHIEK